MDSDANVNMVVDRTTTLIEAAREGHKDVVLLLLDRGADVNKRATDTTALIAAVEGGHKDVVSLLLDRGADLNMVVHDTTALVAAAKKGLKDIVSLLLGRGADVNMVVCDTTALIAAAEEGYKDIVSLLLHRGADVNMIVYDTTVLMAAITIVATKGHACVEIVRLLLDRGADLNAVTGQYGTALIAAICMCNDHLPTNDSKQQALLLMLLDRNPDVSIKAGVYGTALIATISKLHFEVTEQSNHNQQDTVDAQFSSGWQWDFLNKLLSSSYLTTQDHLNVAVGEHGTPLAAAITKGNLQLLRLLVQCGGNIGSVGDSCGIALRAALATGWGSQQLYDILQYLVDEGADINVVSSQQFGSVLGQAAYMGDTRLVSFLLGCPYEMA